MKKQLEIDARKDDYASKLRALKETENTLEKRRQSIGLQREEVAQMQNEYENKMKTLAKEYEEKEVEIQNIRQQLAEKEKNLEELLKSELAKKTNEIEAKIDAKYNKRNHDASAQENQIEQPSSQTSGRKPALAAVPVGTARRAQVSTPKESEPEVSLQNDIDTSAKHVDGQSVGALDGAQGENHATVGKSARIKRLSMLRKKKAEMAAFVPTGKSDPKSGEAQSPVKRRRSSNYDRLKRLRQLKEKAKAGAQKNVGSVTEGGAQLAHQLQEKEEQLLKLEQENRNVAHDLERKSLRIVELERSVSHETKQSAVDKGKNTRSRAATAELVRFYCAAPRGRKEVSRGKDARGKRSEEKMEAADLEYARRLSQQINTSNDIDGNANIVMAPLPKLDENYFSPKPQSVHASAASSVETGKKNASELKALEQLDEEVARAVSRQLNLKSHERGKAKRDASIDVVTEHDGISDAEVARRLSQSLNMQQMEVEPTQDRDVDRNRQKPKSSRRSSWSSWWGGGE